MSGCLALSPTVRNIGQVTSTQAAENVGIRFGRRNLGEVGM